MLTIDAVSVRFPLGSGRFVEALDRISFDVGKGRFVAIVGPSGCGKSTLLRIVAGLHSASDGTVLAGGEPVHGPSRQRGMVFQSYTLFPWLTVRGNVAFGPSLNGASTAERAAIADRFIQQVGLTGFEHAYPGQLSGGMRQRVALARALAANPEVLLMDEPFGALDSQTRRIMQAMLLSIWQQDHKTVLFVTHDVDEAILLSDTIHVMTARPGRIRRTLAVDLPRPRTLETLTSAPFLALKQEIDHLIYEQALAAAAAADAAVRTGR